METSRVALLLSTFFFFISPGLTIHIKDSDRIVYEYEELVKQAGGKEQLKDVMGSSKFQNYMAAEGFGSVSKPGKYRDMDTLKMCIEREKSSMKDVDEYPDNIQMTDWQPKEETLCAFKCMAEESKLLQFNHLYPDMLKNFAGIDAKLDDMYLMHAKYCLTNLRESQINTCQDMKPVMACILKTMPLAMDNTYDRK